MRLVTLGALLSMAVIAVAHAASVDRVQIVRAGLWNPGDGARPAFVRVTDTVPAKVGTIFGIEWRPLGRGGDGASNVKVRWLYPPPGLQHPVTRVRRNSDEFDYPVTMGAREVTVIELNSEAMLLPGKWVVEINDAARPLARQEFTLTR